MLSLDLQSQGFVPFDMTAPAEAVVPSLPPSLAQLSAQAPLALL